MVILTSAAEAREYLENTPAVWRFLFAAAHGRMPYGAARESYRDRYYLAEASFDLVWDAAVEKCKQMARDHETGAGVPRPAAVAS